MRSLLRTAVIASVLLTGAPAFGQGPNTNADSDTVSILASSTARSGGPTLMSHIAKNPIPASVDELVAKLNQPNICGKEALPDSERDVPCAIIVYYLFDKDATAYTPQLVFRAIQSISHPGNRADTTMRIIDLDGGLKSYSGDRLDEPLRTMRVPNSCRRSWDLNLIREVKRCKRVSARYVPFGIIGYIENDEQKILTGKVRDTFFSVGLRPNYLRWEDDRS